MPIQLTRTQSLLCLIESKPHAVSVLQAIIEALGVAIPQLSSVIGLFMILFIIFGLSGVALFSGAYHRRCVLYVGSAESEYEYSYAPWFCGNMNPITHKTKARCPLIQPQLLRLGHAACLIRLIELLTCQEKRSSVWTTSA